jgi:hypothetical protein
MRRHILPNLMHIVMIALVMDFSGLVLAEAVLSYVGIGVDPTMISFGTMINTRAWNWRASPWSGGRWRRPSCFMFVLVLAANLFADVVRDAFDPRMARRGLTKGGGMMLILKSTCCLGFASSAAGRRAGAVDGISFDIAPARPSRCSANRAAASR